MPDVPVVTAGLIVKVRLTVTNLLCDVDLVVGMTWLQSVNPVVDWGSVRVYVPNAVQIALLQGSWLAGHVQAGIITLFSSEKELQELKDEEKNSRIAVLTIQKF